MTAQEMNQAAVDAGILALIERQDEKALDALQIRGGWEYDLARVGEGSFVGYDYANQRWIEHVWTVMS